MSDYVSGEICAAGERHIITLAIGDGETARQAFDRVVAKLTAADDVEDGE